ncbi:MAG: low molecular weight protein-tyrosine-phosphatase [Acidimicrobiales bacterium]
MEQLIDEAGLAGQITVDSAGTSSDEIGHRPDRRACAEASRRGLRLEHRAWRFEADDFDRFDHVLAADQVNAARLRERACTDHDRAKVRLLRALDPDSDPADLDVPDPWYGGVEGFTLVFDQIEAACRGLLAELRAEHGI